jgi:FeoC like transcriptional regulator
MNPDSTPSNPSFEPEANQIDTLNLADTLQDIVRWMARQKTVTLTDVAGYLNQDAAAVQPMMDTLVQQGLVQVLPPGSDGKSPNDVASNTATPCCYQLRLGNKRGRQASSSIWNDLGI